MAIMGGIQHKHPQSLATMISITQHFLDNHKKKKKEQTNKGNRTIQATYIILLQHNGTSMETTLKQEMIINN